MPRRCRSPRGLIGEGGRPGRSRAPAGYQDTQGAPMEIRRVGVCRSGGGCVWTRAVENREDAWELLIGALGGDGRGGGGHGCDIVLWRLGVPALICPDDGPGTR